MGSAGMSLQIEQGHHRHLQAHTPLMIIIPLIGPSLAAELTNKKGEKNSVVPQKRKLSRNEENNQNGSLVGGPWCQSKLGKEDQDSKKR